MASSYRLSCYHQILRFLFGSLCFFLAAKCTAESINIAVASNALAAIKTISTEFEKQTGHHVIISTGSTGKLYAQIMNGAPFDMFLAANEREPTKLEQSGVTVPESRFTYALGRLIMWSGDKALLKRQDMPDTIATVLSSKAVTRIAIANPKIAPYGLAAQQMLQNLGLWDVLQGKIIRGENVSQTYQFAMTNNAQIAFIAKAQLRGEPMSEHGSFWVVPESYYSPIRQQAVLLQRSQQIDVARLFANYLRSKNAIDVLKQQYGYGVEMSVSGS